MKWAIVIALLILLFLGWFGYSIRNADAVPEQTIILNFSDEVARNASLYGIEYKNITEADKFEDIPWIEYVLWRNSSINRASSAAEFAQMVGPGGKIFYIIFKPLDSSLEFRDSNGRYHIFNKQADDRSAGDSNWIYINYYGKNKENPLAAVKFQSRYAIPGSGFSVANVTNSSMEFHYGPKEARRDVINLATLILIIAIVIVLFSRLPDGDDGC